MFDSLNPEQRTAATHGEGPLLIVAGAGTGKTTTLAARVSVPAGTRRPARARPAADVQPPRRPRDARARRAPGRSSRRRPGLGRHVPRGRQSVAPHPRSHARPVPRLHRARSKRRRRRDEPAARGARVRHARAAVPAQGDARADPLPGGQRRREARCGDRASLPVVHRGDRRHPRDLPRLRRTQARATDVGLRRPAAVLEGARRLAADRSAGRRDVRPHPGRRVPGHERAAGRHPRVDAAHRHAAQPHGGRRRRAGDLRVPRRDRAQHPGVPRAVPGRRRSSSSNATTARPRRSWTCPTR